MFLLFVPVPHRSKEADMPATATPPYAPLRLRTPRNGGPAIHGDRVRAAAAVRRASLFAGSTGSRRTLSGLRADPRQAVQEDAIHCLVCGGVFRQLTNTHLRSHALTADEYKRRFGYNRGRPLMCRALRSLYADRAVRNGLASRIRQRPILARPELRRRGGARTIALEELLTRRDVRRGLREPHAAV
jgi:predicted transcriptional regulator